MNISVDLTIYFENKKYFCITMIRQYRGYCLWVYKTQTAQPAKTYHIRTKTAKNFITKHINKYT